MRELTLWDLPRDAHAVRAPPTDECPRCGGRAPLTDGVDVDVGPGFLSFDAVYTCPVHGDYSYGAYDPEAKRLEVIFREEP